MSLGTGPVRAGPGQGPQTRLLLTDAHTHARAAAGRGPGPGLLHVMAIGVHLVPDRRVPFPACAFLRGSWPSKARQRQVGSFLRGRLAGEELRVAVALRMARRLSQVPTPLRLPTPWARLPCSLAQSHHSPQAVRGWPCLIGKTLS